MKFDKCDISNIQISILMSKSIFINYLPPVRPKLLPKLNMLIIYWILTHSIFKICQSLFWCQNAHLTFQIWRSRFKCKKWFFIKYIPVARPKLVPKWKTLRIYWNFAELIFQICRFLFWFQKWFLLNIYHVFGPNMPRN